MTNTTSNSTAIFPPSVFTHDYTYVQGAWMCIRWMYPIHIGFAYLVAIMGIGCFVTRLINPIKFLHVWFGRFFMIFMFCCMASSLVIFNTGLPTAIMVFFVLLTIGQSVGWLAIKIHSMIMEKQAMQIVQAKIMDMMAGQIKVQQKNSDAVVMKGEAEKVEQSHEDHKSDDTHSDDSAEKPPQDKESVIDGIAPTFNLEKEIAKAKGQIANNKGFFGRFFSLKSVHALGMFVAWWNIFGRVVVTDPFVWDGCWSYPAYKTTSGEIKYANEMKDNGSAFVANVPLFVSVSFIPAFVLFIAIGFCYSLFFGLLTLYRQNKEKKGISK